MLLLARLLLIAHMTATLLAAYPSTQPARASLPELFLSASNKLFEQGLADPGGGEYRELEIVIVNLGGQSTPARIHAWLMPSRKGAERTCVAWNGLVYAVTSVGEKADLRADVLELIRADEAARAKLKSERPNSPFYRSQHAIPNGYSASQASLLPVKSALLLRLGEEELAAMIWDAWTAGFAGTSANNIESKDPYLMLASDWAWALFDRAVNSHMKGDDKTALSSTRLLASIEGQIETEAERRGFKKQDAYNGGAPRYLTFLQPLGALLRDQERRAREGRRSRASLAEIERIPDKSARINALISELDEVAARQWGQPGGVNLRDDAIVKALLAQGEDAVRPLLTALESDERLTRSVSYHRSFFTHRHLISVAETAYAVLTEILKTTSFARSEDNISIESVEGRRKLAARIRAYLEKYARGTIEERWYGVLSDDGASADEWMQAAANIVYVSHYQGTPPAWVFTTAPVPSVRNARGISLRGEPLRGKSSPSVAELFARRMTELAERKAETQPFQNLSTATNFALALLAWEGPSALPQVRSFQNFLKGRYEATNAKTDVYNRSYLRGMLVSLYLKRFEVKDRTAFSEYVEWLCSIRPEEAGEGLIYLFTPMWRYANHAEMTQAAGRMFAQSGSPWLPLIDAENRESFYRGKLLETPMLNLKSFRERVLEGLADKTVVGTLRPGRTIAGDRFDLNVENTYTALLVGASNSVSAYFPIPANDARAARATEPLSIRVCDVYASRLVRLNGAPPFQIYWTEAERDRAIAELVTFITEHGGRFTSSSDFE